MDADPAVARAVVRALRAHADVTVAHAPDAALERVRRGEHFDLVLCAIVKRGARGLGFFEHLVAWAPELRERFVFATADVTEDFKRYAGSTGRPWLEKPFSVQAVLSLLSR